MPKVELYINLQLCDLTGSEQIEVDYTSFDISKIGSRGGARSYSFNLPKTNRNKAVLENPEIVNNLSTLPYTRLPCRILVDGIDVQIRFAEIESAGSVYAVRVYGANSDFFARLGESKISDLDFSEFNHYWTMANTVASRLNTGGYIYALIDYHEDSPNFACNNDNAVLRIDYLPPSFFVNTILEKIFSTLLLTLENEVEEDSANLISPYFGVPLVRNLDGKRYEGNFELDLGITSGIQLISIPPAGALTPIFFNVLNSTPQNYFLAGTNGSDNKFYFADAITLDIDFFLVIDNPDFFPCDVYVEYVYTVLGNPNMLGHFIINTLPGVHNYSYQITVSVKPENPENTALPNISFRAYPLNIPSSLTLLNGSQVAFSNVTIDTPLTTSYRNPIAPQGYLTVSSILPDLTQTEFIKNYMLLFGLIPIVNEVTNTVKFVKFDSITSNLHLAYDWSNKIDFSEPHEVKFMLNDYAQKNNLKWAEDGNEPIPVNANGIIEISNNNLELEKDIVEMDFAPTNTNFRLNGLGGGNRILPQIGIYRQGELANQKVPRLLQLTKKTAAEWGLSIYGMQYDDSVPANSTGVADNIPVCHFIDIAESFNLGFGNNIIENYYGSIAAIIGKLKVVRELVRLNAADLSDIDFTRPVWIAKHESYFYISSIKGFSYTENKSTIVELVKLNING